MIIELGLYGLTVEIKLLTGDVLQVSQYMSVTLR